MASQFDELLPEDVSPDPITRSLGQNPTKPVRVYATQILTIQRILINSQQYLRRKSIGWEGVRGRRTVSDMHAFLSQYFEQIADLQTAAIQPSKMPEIDADSSADEKTRGQIETLRESGNLYRELERLEQLSNDISRQMNEIVDTANTRLSLLISVFAIIISTISILL